MKRASVLLLVIFSQYLIGQNSLLWEISGNGAKDKSYLYGTLHLPNAKYFYVNPKVHVVKKKVDAGVFEVQLSQDSLAYISFQLMAKSGQRVSDLCSKEEQELVYTFFKKHFGFEELITNGFIPIALNTLVLDVFSESDTTGAIDQLLQNDFKQQGKPVYALESVKFQADLLTGMPIEKQKESLIETLSDLDSIANSLHELDSVYMNQDLAGIALLLNDLESEEYLSKELLNYSRNLKMIEKLPAMMEKESLLIAIGAAHLGGEEGLISLLRKKGYSINPIK